ncbi:MAG: sigma 54-interacting transcriptional regulator [Spirochaetaceae bacterium]|jgi:Nif-specific regulatory protein|nr:sigma 54-interacting transcriptional regulator [Spirochaetaceae bacterium]
MLSKIDVRKFNTLIEINALINSNYSDVNELLTQILESATVLCQGDASSLLLVNKETRELYFEVALGVAGAAVKHYTVKMGEGIAGWVALHNKSIIVDDAENDKRHLKNIPEEIHYTSKTILAVPMRVKDECIGVIEVINKKDGKRFTQEDLEWLEIFANLAGIAVVNAQSIEKARNEIKLLHDQLKIDQGYHTMIAKSPVILEKLEIIDRIAKTDSSVLILGESGVGKELFAEQIHIRSPRNKRPFVRVNCAALPEGLLESELFGHIKGAFTNAIANRQGRFELASGGTIFLDEIGDLPLALQAKLLRVIQEKTFEKVGSDTSITVDVRILAATNRDIEKQVEKGEFRSDLYYRLNVLPLYIPPLRQRPEDISELADFFLRKYTRETNKNFDGFSSKAMEIMLSYSWPGNIRELENCIQRACVIGKTSLIQEEDLFIKNAAGPASGQEDKSRNLKTAINVFKSRFIRKVLEEHNWNQTETARVLDIQRTYLSRLIKELNINNSKE